MKKVFLEEKTPLLIIFGLFFLTYILTWGHWGDLILDCGREAYIPYAIAKGKVLHKDIFCIYGPLPYLFNTFFYKIIAPNLSTLYIIGGFLSAVYILGVYLCSREFLSKALSTCISIIVIYSVIFDSSIFNFIFPYSYAMVFASVFAIWILFCLLKYIKTKNPLYLSVCAILWGGICVSKIDFVSTIIPIAAVFFLFEKNKKQEGVRFIAYSLIIPALTYLVLFSQGLNFSDIAKNSHFITLMLKSESLKTFYNNYAIVSFRFEYFISNLINLTATVFIAAIFFYISLYSIRKKTKFIKYGITGIATIFCLVILSLQETIPQKIFALLPYTCFLIFISITIKYLRSNDYKNSNTLSVLVLFFFALICSIKNFHSLILSFYGAYSFAPLLICFVLFIKELFENCFLYNTKKQYEGLLSVFLIIISIIYSNSLIYRIIGENTTVKSHFGTMKVTKHIGQPFNELLSYLDSHSSTNDSIVVLPEGIMINFLSGRHWDFYQTSFIPLDFDTFSEDNIVKDIIAQNPRYVIFSARDTQEYGKKTICNNYGYRVCKYVLDNYSLEAAFGDKHRVYLFKYIDEDNELITDE